MLPLTEITLLALVMLLAVAPRWQWRLTRPVRSATRWLWAWASANPAAAVLWCLVVLHAIMVAELPAALRDEVLRAHSTNPQQLDDHPVSALLTSALWVEPSDVPFITLLTLLVLAPAERWLGSRRAAMVFFAGHVIASRLIAPSLLGDPALEHVVDVGVSYGGLCLAALLTYRIRSWTWRIAAMIALPTLVGLSGGLFDWWTNDGHLVAVFLGFALWPVTRAASVRARIAGPWIQPPGYADLPLPRVTPRYRRLVVVGLFVLASVVYVWRPGSSVTTGIRDYQVSADRITALRVQASGGGIEVVAGEPGVIRVRETLRHDRARPRTSHATNAAGELVLESGDCGFSIVAWFDREKCTVNYRVQVPAALAVRLESNGGKIVLDRLAGDVQVDADGGAVRATGMTSATFTAHGDGGKLDVAFAGVPDLVDVTGDGGSVTVRLPDAAYAVDASTGSDGTRVEVAVRVDPASPHRIRARSAGSRVSILPA
ncbi:rhomboid-like protein [Longispora sp. K20-0274]|uniref:rhomboid-like protein n=1 Tax=Longispora sp. K20-0274 TaxID=3088255 RepID=UPI0039998A5C